MAKKSAKSTLPRILGARVLVRADPDEVKTPGGIVLPASAIKQGEMEIDTRRGVILEVGEGRFNEHTCEFVGSEFEPEQRVVFYGSTVEIDHEGEKLLIVPEGQILAVLS